MVKLNILFVHQNFPAQFLHLAPALARVGHNVVALTMRTQTPSNIENIKVIQYSPSKENAANIHPWLLDFESKLIRGEACFLAAQSLKRQNFSPELIIVHPGWGEGLFLKEVWPNAILINYCEYYYNVYNSDLYFDPEFSVPELTDLCKIKLKNINNYLSFNDSNFGISPTNYQRETYPENWRSKIKVLHDGIDTSRAAPNPNIKIRLSNGVFITRESKIITFVARNLEPFRGFHSLMRTIPYFLKRNPDAIVLIVGGDGNSYGGKPPLNKTWKEIFLKEIIGELAKSELARVHFLGNLPYSQYLNILQLSKVHLYLSYPFVVSWSLLEAMSIGVPIVANGTIPIKEFVIEDYNGLIVDFFNYKEIADKISLLLENEDERVRLAKNGREFIRSNYDLNNICLPNQLKLVHALLT